jgi:hypothetical protein
MARLAPLARMLAAPPHPWDALPPPRAARPFGRRVATANIALTEGSPS